MATKPHAVARQRRVNPVFVFCAAAIVIAGLFALVATSGDDGDGSSASPTTPAPATGEPDPDAGDPEPVSLATLAAAPFDEDAPEAYVVVYDVVENDLARTETWTVQRPFESLILGTRDGATISGTATSLTQLRTYLADRQGWLAIQPELHRAAFDQHPLVTMRTMIDLGLADEVGSDTVAGEPCRSFVTGQPLGAGAALAPTDAESVEVCIDAAGLVRREVWTLEGTVISTRTATRVDLAPTIDGAMFDPGPPIADVAEYAPLLATEASPADEAMLAARLFEIVVPAGYTPAGTVVRTSGGGAGGGVTEVVAFYTDGIDLIEVAEVTVGNGDADLTTGGAIPVTVPGGGTFGDAPDVWFAPDFRASALRARLSNSSYVEIRGVEPASLVEVFSGITIR